MENSIGNIIGLFVGKINTWISCVDFTLHYLLFILHSYLNLISNCLLVFLPVYLPLGFSSCMPAFILTCLPFYLLACLSTNWPACLAVCQMACLSTFRPAGPPVFLPHQIDHQGSVALKESVSRPKFNLIYTKVKALNYQPGN